jgi:N-acetylmuramoyl-L-alanine amidase
MKKELFVLFEKTQMKHNRWLVLFTIITIVTMLLSAGCAPKYSKYKNLYSSLFEENPVFEQNILMGRRIVIDPGHGGSFKGALGADSLSEAEVNLGVALYLWGMLEEAGASVQLTRTSDHDFITNDSQQLESDLRARMEKANSFKPEVFISIHHNSTLPINRDKNRIEIFYNSKDPGASLELARLVRLHLARNLGIEDSEIKPGNYYVLRNSAGHASILGEASYISNPVVEGKLKLSSKQKLEAESYFIALKDYFSRGVPTLELISPQADTLFSPDEIVYKIKRGNSIPVDPASAKIYFDGKAKTPVFDRTTETLHYGIASEIPNSIHTIRASIKSVKGATATANPHSFVLNRPPKYFLPLPPRLRSKNSLTLSVKIFDEYGNPVIDGAPALISPFASGKKYSGKCNNGIFSFHVKESLLPASFSIEISGVSDTLYFAKPPSTKANIISIVNALDGSTVPFPFIIDRSGTQSFKGDENGIIQLPDSILNKQVNVFAGGFKPILTNVNISSNEKQISIIKLPPLYEGKLTSKRIALNPARGGADGGTTGIKMIKETSINLKIAKRLGGLLKTAGAVIQLTREGEETLSNQERVARINRFNPKLAIEINHDLKLEGNTSNYSIHYYPGSEGGTKISNLFQSALTKIYPGNNNTTCESADFFLTHTSCPACEIHFASLSGNPLEEFVSNPDYISLVSESIFSSILNFFDDKYIKSYPVKIKIISNGQCIPGIYVTIDNALTLPTNSNGLAVFSNIAPGRHMILVQTRNKQQYCGIHDIHSSPEDEIIIELK